MALLINKATPAGSDAPSTLDNDARTFKEAVQDIFGVPNNTTISNAGSTFTSGGLATINLTAAAATAGTVFDVAAGHAQRDIITAVGMGMNMQADTWNINTSGNSETVAIGPLAFFGIPTWTSTGSSFTVTDGATVYIQGVPVGSTNVTVTNAFALWVDAGATRLDGQLRLDDALNMTKTTVTAGALFDIAPGHSQRDLITSVGLAMHVQADTWDINASGNSETVAIGPLAFFGIPTWTSTGSSYTVTDATTVYIQGVPVGSTNVTVTNAFALWVDAGTTRLDGQLRLDGALNMTKAAVTAGTVFDIAPGHSQRDLVTSVGLGMHMQADALDINASGNSETVAIGPLAFFGIPTWTSTGSSFTVTDGATVYIQGVPVGSTNVTVTNAFALWVDAGATRLDGQLRLDDVVNMTKAAVTAGTLFDIAPGHSQRDLITGVGLGLHIQADTWDINASGNSETVAVGPLAFFGIPTWTSTGSSYTVTDAGTVVIAGVPVGSTNVTVTNAWSLLVQAGNVQIPNSLYIKEQADADGDIAGLGQVWVNTASPNELYFTDDAGTDFKISTSGTLSNIVEDTTPQLGGHLDGQGFDQTKMGTISMTEQGAANADVAGDGQLWVKTATPNELYFTNDAGTDIALGGGVEQASQSSIEAEDDLDRYVPPDLVRHSPGVAKAWIAVDLSGTMEIYASGNAEYNIASIADDGVGKPAVTVTTAFSTTNERTAAGIAWGDGAVHVVMVIRAPPGNTTLQYFHVCDDTDTLVDVGWCSAGMWGDQ